jgi:nitrous oxidase accessory protein NosD
VPSSTYPTIQAAVNDATCATINVAAGTYTELVTINRNVTIRGDGQDVTFVDGSGSGRVFEISQGTVTIKGVTIQHGNAGFGLGGGIANFGTLTVANSTLTANEAGVGGGIANFGTLTVMNSTLAGNTGLDGFGAGIANLGTLTVANSTITDNTAGVEGGGLFNRGTLTVQNSTVADNTAGVDGGGLFNEGTVTLTHVTFENNTPNDCTGCP